MVAAETIRFQRSLKLFQKFSITTEVVGWDEKSIYMQQVFHCNNRQIAVAAINARFLSRDGGKVTPDDLFELLDEPRRAQPELPQWIKTWNLSTATMPLEHIG